MERTEHTSSWIVLMYSYGLENLMSAISQKFFQLESLHNNNPEVPLTVTRSTTFAFFLFSFYLIDAVSAP